MRILFTKGNSILSRTIVNLTEESVSHCAIQYGWFVVHSNLLGVHLEWAENFRRKNTVVFELERTEVSESQSLEDLERLGKILSEAEYSFYDFGALIFIGLTLLARRYLKLPLPKSNLWQSSGMYLCTEWVTATVSPKNKTNAMITPYKLYLALRASERWKDAELFT